MISGVNMDCRFSELELSAATGTGGRSLSTDGWMDWEKLETEDEGEVRWGKKTTRSGS